MRRLPVLLFTALAAGCGFGGDEGTVEARNAAALVLQPSDLPGFGIDSSTGGGGRWRARYRRSRAARAGPVAVDSAVEIWRTSDAAEGRFSTASEEFPETDGWQPIGEPGLGSESFASTRVADGARSYEIVWRDANVTAWVSVRGREGEVPFAGALALVEKQEDRIDDAKR